MPGALSCAEFDADTITHAVRALGPRLLHVTAAENLALIDAEGLWPAAELARRAGVDPNSLLLRTERLRVGQSLLNHQLPLQRYRAAAETWLDCTPREWAAQLDERVFFWPEREAAAFAQSVARDVPTRWLWLDTAALIRAAGPRIFLSPLNSGSFRQIPKQRPHDTPHRYDRGLWLYRPLSEGIPAFRAYRRARGITQALDRVREVSLRGGLDAETLAQVRLTA